MLQLETQCQDFHRSTELASFFSLWMAQMEVHTFLMSFSAMAILILLTNSN